MEVNSHIIYIHYKGGALSIEEIGYATLTNLKFIDNTATDGGALYIINGLVNGTNLNFIGKTPKSNSNIIR